MTVFMADFHFHDIEDNDGESDVDYIDVFTTYAEACRVIGRCYGSAISWLEGVRRPDEQSQASWRLMDQELARRMRDGDGHFCLDERSLDGAFRVRAQIIDKEIENESV